MLVSGFLVVCCSISVMYMIIMIGLMMRFVYVLCFL